MQIQYIGHKDVKTDNVAGTGIVWNGHGDVQEVPDGAAGKLLAHTGVWAAPKAKQAKAPAPPPASPSAPGTPAASPSAAADTSLAALTLVPGSAVGSTAPTAPTDPLKGLEDKAVRAFAKDKGLEIRGLNLLKADNLRAKVTAALAALPAKT